MGRGGERIRDEQRGGEEDRGNDEKERTKGRMEEVPRLKFSVAHARRN